MEPIREAEMQTQRGSGGGGTEAEKCRKGMETAAGIVAAAVVVLFWRLAVCWPTAADNLFPT